MAYLPSPGWVVASTQGVRRVCVYGRRRAAHGQWDGEPPYRGSYHFAGVAGRTAARPAAAAHRDGSAQGDLLAALGATADDADGDVAAVDCWAALLGIRRWYRWERLGRLPAAS